MFDRLRDDIRTALAKDPAATSAAEVVLTYPGVHAVWCYRIAHRLRADGHPLAARVLSHLVRWLTGVEIHPGADIGERLFIDHGMGVVVGETAHIGDDVQLYHGVTLGGNSPRPEKRHPTLEDGVVVGANATLIGDITIGEGARVGAGAVVVDDVPPGETVVGNPARPVSESRAAGGAADEGGVDAEGDADGQTGKTAFDGTTPSSQSASTSASDCQ